MSNAAAEAVRAIRPGLTYIGKQGFSYGAGASTETVGARQVCINVLPMPPGAKAKVHFETIAYPLEGECAVFHGDELGYRAMAHAGDRVYLPEDVPHAPYNQSTASCRCLVVHSSGIDQDGSFSCPSWTLCSPRNNDIGLNQLTASSACHDRDPFQGPTLGDTI
jgi:uncharacterized RmlC-like cupin family protein